jgi:hypothetical protein
MKRLVVTADALFLAHQAQAAEISIIADETDDHDPIILIKGQIGEPQREVATFGALAGYNKKPAIVFLDSTGGKLVTAIQIGLIIHKHGLTTAVADNALCASACALVWLAGKERCMGTGARIGFHAARKSADSLEVAPSGNAIAGAYLYQVGITDFTTISLLTSELPKSMAWRGFGGELDRRVGVKAFSLSQEKWAWAREALATRVGYGLGGRIDAPGHLPAASAYSEPAQNPLEKSAEPRPPKKVKEQDRHANPEPAAARQAQHNDLIAQASRRVENGDVAGAREMLAAAEDGSQPLVAFALAETYDPNMLAAWGTRGVIGDIVRARTLYRKALNLGVASAYARLEALK